MTEFENGFSSETFVQMFNNCGAEITGIYWQESSNKAAVEINSPRCTEDEGAIYFYNTKNEFCLKGIKSFNRYKIGDVGIVIENEKSDELMLYMDGASINAFLSYMWLEGFISGQDAPQVDAEQYHGVPPLVEDW